MESIKKNIVYQTMYQLLSFAIPFITAPYVARVLGASGIGTYSYTFSVVSYFVLFAKLGIHVYGNREIASVRDDKNKLNTVFSELMTVHIVASIIALVAYSFYIAFAPANLRFIALIQGIYIIAEFFDVNWFYFGLEKVKITVTRNIFIKLGTFIAILLLVKNADDVWKYCSILAVGMLVSESVVWLFLPQYVKPVVPKWNGVKKHIVPLISFLIPSIAISLYKIMDKIMLGGMVNTTEVGFYENSEKIITIALGLVNAVGIVMMPRMANLAAKKDTTESRRLLDNTMKSVMFLTIAMSFGIAGVATNFAPTFFGDEFAKCNVLIVGLAVSMPFTSFANILRTQYLIPNHKDRVFQGSVLCGAAVNLIVNFLLIPKLYSGGAVLGTIFAELTVCAVQTFFSKKALPIKKYLVDCIPAIFAGGAMALCVNELGFRMGTGVVTLFVQVIVGATIYVILLGGYLWLKKDDILQNLFSKSRK